MLKQVFATSTLFLGDVHIPYEDKAAVRAAIELAAWVQPNDVMLLGDVIDFYPLSSYTRDPHREMTLQSDIERTREFLRRLRKVCPQSNITYIMGNHEDRLRRYLLTNAKNLSNLEDLRFERLLRLDDYGVVLANGSFVQRNDLLVTHGDRVSNKSGYTAHRMMESVGMSGVSGHTHRAAHIAKRTYGRTTQWVESGCLCNMDVEFAAFTDWQHAVTLGVTVDGHTDLTLVHIHKGRAYLNGVLFDGNEGGETQ